ncbi:MAG: VOC family protein [Eubacteriales bacterium]
MTTFNHFNFNVFDLDKSIAFYKEALNLSPARERVAEDGSFKIVFLEDEAKSPFRLELTWMRDRKEPYNLGDLEYHLAFVAEEFDEIKKKHADMGCICYENHKMGIYFITDPDGYWLEITPLRK